MELAKTVALTAVLFIVVLILTSGNSLGQNSPRPTGSPPKQNEASFQRSGTSQAATPAGTDRAPAKKKKKAQAEAPQCVYKPVMTERDMAACRAARRK